MAVSETGPRPLPQEVIERQRNILRSGEIIPKRGKDFTKAGTFRAGNVEVFFTPILLDYDPNLYGLRISRYGTILLYDSSYSHLQRAPILSPDLRIVDPNNSGEGIVGESGYILKGDYRVGGKRITKKRLDRILTMAEEGIRLPAFSESSFIKVDRGLTGQKLLALTFDQRPPNSLLSQDVAVIDPENRKLVEREITKPLALQRWIKSPITVDKFKQINWIYPFI